VTELGAATPAIARGVEIAARRTVETAGKVACVRRPNECGHGEDRGRRSRWSAARIRGEVDQLFHKLKVA